MQQRNSRVTINLDSSEPAYRQIAVQLRTLIIAGVLPAGSNLPAVRRLAMDLGVHFNTVAEAYRVLAEEGWLDVTHGRCARVVERESPKPSKAEVDTLRRKLRQTLAELRAKGLSSACIRKELDSLLEAVEP
jgi:DNA-binding transcriptional regulator YhcF (GntR family)